MNYFQLAQIKGVFEELDQWIRRRLRCIQWRQWKRVSTRAKNLNGRGPWWNAGAKHMNFAMPTKLLDTLGLVSLQTQHEQLQRTTRNAVYGTVRTVV